MLVVEDDETVARIVKNYFEREGFAVEAVKDGVAGLQRASFDRPALIVLDLMLPRLDGFEVCRRLRGSGIPVIMLTARGEEPERVAGLELGADDYVVKPFSPRELVARANAVLRRAAGDNDDGMRPDELLRAGSLEVDTGARTVRVDGREVRLTAREFDLLAFLMRHPECVFRREELLERVWGYAFGDTATVTVHIQRLREKVEPDPSSPRWIVTVWGVGYRFDP